MFADGVVMPRPDSRPVAQLAGQAMIAMTPMTTAVAALAMAGMLWCSASQKR